MKRRDKNPFGTPSKFRRIISRPEDDSDSSSSSFSDLYDRQTPFTRDGSSNVSELCVCNSSVCICHCLRPRERTTPVAEIDEDEVNTHRGRNVTEDRESEGFVQAGPSGLGRPSVETSLPDSISFQGTSSVSFFSRREARPKPNDESPLILKLKALRELYGLRENHRALMGSSANPSAAVEILPREQTEENRDIVATQTPADLLLISTAAGEENYKQLYEELHGWLLALLECPVCLEQIMPPIPQCKRGHLICSRCKNQLQICPTCRDRFAENRNLGMERVAERVRYPCKNAASGCTSKFLLATKEEHEASCQFRTYVCFFRSCGWAGLHQDLSSHIRETHSRRIVEGDRHSIELILNNPTSFFSDWAIFCHGEVFRINVFENIPNSMLYASVYYVGPHKKAGEFTYTIKMRGTDDRELTYRRKAHSYSVKLTSCYGSGDCFVVKGQVAQHFVLDGKISVEVSVVATPSAAS